MMRKGDINKAWGYGSASPDPGQGYKSPVGNRSMAYQQHGQPRTLGNHRSPAVSRSPLGHSPERNMSPERGYSPTRRAYSPTRRDGDAGSSPLRGQTRPLHNSTPNISALESLAARDAQRHRLERSPTQIIMTGSSQEASLQGEDEGVEGAIGQLVERAESLVSILPWVGEEIEAAGAQSIRQDVRDEAAERLRECIAEFQGMLRVLSGPVQAPIMQAPQRGPTSPTGARKWRVDENVGSEGDSPRVASSDPLSFLKTTTPSVPLSSAEFQPHTSSAGARAASGSSSGRLESSYAHADHLPDEHHPVIPVISWGATSVPPSTDSGQDVSSWMAPMASHDGSHTLYPAKQQSPTLGPRQSSPLWGSRDAHSPPLYPDDRSLALSFTPSTNTSTTVKRSPKPTSPTLGPSPRKLGSSPRSPSNTPGAAPIPLLRKPEKIQSTYESEGANQGGDAGALGTRGAGAKWGEGHPLVTHVLSAIKNPPRDTANHAAAASFDTVSSRGSSNIVHPVSPSGRSIPSQSGIISPPLPSSPDDGPTPAARQHKPTTMLSARGETKGGNDIRGAIQGLATPAASAGMGVTQGTPSSSFESGGGTQPFARLPTGETAFRVGSTVRFDERAFSIEDLITGSPGDAVEDAASLDGNSPFSLSGNFSTLDEASRPPSRRSPQSRSHRSDSKGSSRPSPFESSSPLPTCASPTNSFPASRSRHQSPRSLSPSQTPSFSGGARDVGLAATQESAAEKGVGWGSGKQQSPLYGEEERETDSILATLLAGGGRARKGTGDSCLTASARSGSNTVTHSSITPPGSQAPAESARYTPQTSFSSSKPRSPPNATQQHAEGCALQPLPLGSIMPVADSKHAWTSQVASYSPPASSPFETTSSLRHPPASSSVATSTSGGDASRVTASPFGMVSPLDTLLGDGARAKSRASDTKSGGSNSVWNAAIASNDFLAILAMSQGSASVGAFSASPGQHTPASQVMASNSEQHSSAAGSTPQSGVGAMRGGHSRDASGDDTSDMLEGFEDPFMMDADEGGGDSPVSGRERVAKLLAKLQGGGSGAGLDKQAVVGAGVFADAEGLHGERSVNGER